MTAPKDGLCGDPGRRLGQEEVLAIMQAVLQLCGQASFGAARRLSGRRVGLE